MMLSQSEMKIISPLQEGGQADIMVVECYGLKNKYVAKVFKD
jgi:hypothetical protein